MNNKLVLISFALACMAFLSGHTQEPLIRSRSIFIGDAGEVNASQSAVIAGAAEQVLKSKTTVFFLGDNIYPRGMSLSPSEKGESEEILKAQFSPFRTKQVPVYFLPGNHDWDRSGKKGLEKIRAQSHFLQALGDPLLKMVPGNGCPDPVEINISDNLTVIAYDSEWWLFPFSKSSRDTSCNCNSREDVIERLEGLLYKNRDKTVLLASHHPFLSYGVHGGHFSWKDHLFPLTNLNKSLYLPLPLIGSLYPILRSTVFLHPEDISHPAYQRMMRDIKTTVDNSPNLLYMAGHEHGLQLLLDESNLQIVSGGGAKKSFIKDGKKALFAASKMGFVVVDEWMDKTQHIRFFALTDGTVREVYSYKKTYIDPIPLGDSLFLRSSNEDSTLVQANPTYNRVGKLHRKLFGENYRQEWAAQTKVPIIRISSFQGGLTPLKRGGGMQTVSLRLADKNGKEWVIRSVNKNTDALLPVELRQTFAHDFLDDANSAQHPYSALMIPPLAEAVKIAHSNPIIGIIAPDSALGAYNAVFANTLCLIEEREPLGDSDNTLKMLNKVNHDNDDIYKAKTFLRARMLDLLVGDWDRHEDQWRWYDTREGKDKDYLPVPRDRDQAFRKVEGFFPNVMSRSWALPTLQGFRSTIDRPKYSLFKSDFLNAHPKNQFTHDEWMEITNEFVNDMSDEVLEEALKKLPTSSYAIRHDSLFSELKQRRAAISNAMETYYQFTNSIVDIKLSDKHEWVEVKDGTDKGVKVTVRKINKDGERKGKLMEKEYAPSLTKEIRIYLANGDDSVYIENKHPHIKLRVIGGQGRKVYHIDSTARPVKIYDSGQQSSFSGQLSKLRKHLSTDSANLAFVPVNLYSVWMPLVTVGFNADDGVMIGGGFRYTHQRGFRKSPFANQQQLLISGALATGAVKVKYKGVWKETVGKADLLADVNIYAPNNTQNFFGLGNNSSYDKENHSVRYYRSRFNLYEAHSALRWTPDETSSISVGPSLQLYYYDSDDNVGRFINNTNELHTYDSLTIAKDKLFAGFNASFLKDNRNDKILTTEGGYVKLDIQGLTGLNGYSKSFLQAKAEIAVYKSISSEAITFSNRLGGGTTLGQTTFYQSLFLGGQGNLWGYRQYRFAGEHLFFNNFEARIKLAQIGSYILPGQLGLLAFYDIGKVWVDGLDNRSMHQGTGAGLYYAPARIALLQLVAGHSKEGWYPYFTMGFRF
ncbi:BamA/TamA family outer membrane protein [Olivibacter sp. XZL3]|uniref:BamA/TamA family outer membrane protein n=1 Tax=Olivibacter sp. XZL3 TaxID=1735116 RepID=UPI001065A5BE|nr:BamA/TamA family outer membrane protein [Olivibacter sp. XZL3]